MEAGKARYQKTLQVLQNIRALCGGQLNLPQICVVGDQSSGKSALLETTTGIKFPVKSGICTKAPIVVECKNDPNVKATDFYIQDRATLAYSKVPLESLDSEIMRIQDQDLVKMACSSESAPKVSQEEIRLQAVGSTQIDIVVVDLPGLINTGAGKDDTRTLVRKYIQQKQTLILLVSEAKQDWELTSAIELAGEFDANHERTVRVLTKFDTFDSSEASSTACQLIKNEAHSKLGAHAVICRPSGKDKYIQEKEVKALQEQDDELPPERSGVSALKDRLPRLFEELIQANLPGLKEEIDTKLYQTKRELQRVGEHAISPVMMLSECQHVLLKNFDVLEQELSPSLEALKEAIHATNKSMTEEWCAEKLKANVFKCPFFQGEPAFLDCLDEIASWWKPLLAAYVEAVDRKLKESFACIEKEASGVSSGLLAALHTKWAEVCPALFSDFVDACEAALDEEKDFGTINHYLQDKYTEDMLLPDDLVENFFNRLTLSDILKPVKDETKCYFENGECWWKKPIQVPEKIEWKQNLSEKFLTEKRGWGEEFSKKSLHEQLQRRLFAAVKAAWAVEKKTFTDMVMKKTRDFILKARKKWITTQLLTDKELQAAAVEDSSQEARRQAIQVKLDNLRKCQAEIGTIISSPLVAL